MSTPVRTLVSSTVSIGNPTKKSEYDDLRSDAIIALTEFDYGTTAQLPVTPDLGQKYLDTQADILYTCFDASVWQAIASDKCTINGSQFIHTGVGPHAIGGALSIVGALDGVTTIGASGTATIGKVVLRVSNDSVVDVVNATASKSMIRMSTDDGITFRYLGVDTAETFHIWDTAATVSHFSVDTSGNATLAGSLMATNTISGVASAADMVLTLASSGGSGRNWDVKSTTTGAFTIGNDLTAVALTLGSGGDVSLLATKNLYFDGGGDTYITEVAANHIRIFTAGVERFNIAGAGNQSNNASFSVLGGFLSIQATENLYFDGGGDTYITESSANRVRIVTGANKSVDFTSGTIIVGYGTESSVALKNAANTANSWVWARRTDVGGSNEDLKLLRYVGDSYTGIDLQIGNTTGYLAVGQNYAPSGSARLDVKESSGLATIPTGTWASSIIHASNATTKYGLVVGTNWAAAENFIFSAGNYNASTGAFTHYFDIKGNGSIVMNATAKLYLDGVAGAVGDTWIYESSANNMALVTGGVTALTLTSAQDISIGATKKFYLDGGGDTYIYQSSANVMDFYAGAANALKLQAASAAIPVGVLYLNETANAFSTRGITINQGANDDDAFTLKSSDISVPFTAGIEADTYFAIRKITALGGGANIQGWSDDGTAGLILSGTQNTGSTTKSTAGRGAVWVNAAESDASTGTQALGANENLFAIVNRGTTRFIFDAEGDSHQDVGTAWTNFDIADDLAVLDSIALELHRADDPTKVQIMAREALRGYGRDWLTRHKLVTFNADGHHFVNRSQMQNLLIGAVRHAGRRISGIEERYERRIAQLETCIQQLGEVGA